MARLKYKNSFGSQNSQLDPQRTDLFKITLDLPVAVGLPWDEHVEFAIEHFPFPDRAIETIPIKYLQQTNHLIGADTATGPVEVKVRYVFAQRTAEALERWQWLVRNPITGGVGLTSEVKCLGYMRWLVPNMAKQIADLRGTALPAQDTMRDGLVMVLEGCLIKGLKFADANMAEATVASLSFSLSIDRMYPANLDKMQVLS